MVKLIRLSLLILITALCTTSCQYWGNSLVVGNWQVLYEKGSSLESVSKSTGWEDTSMPGMFRLPYKPVRDFQWAWLRGDFTITGDPARYVGIIPGVVYQLDRVYLNGQLIGRHEGEEFHSLIYSRSYPVPPGLLKKGRNEIYIQIGIYGREYGGITREVMVHTRGDYIKRRILLDFLFRQMPIGMVVFLFAQLAFNIILFLWKRQEKVNLYSALLCLCWISFILTIAAPYCPFSVDLRITYLWSCISLFPIFFLMFIQSFYKIYLPAYNRILIPGLLLITLLILTFQDTTSPWYPARYLGVGTLFFITPFLAYLLYRVNTLKPSRVIYVFFSFGFFPGLFITWDVVNYLWIYHEMPLVHTYTLPLFVIGIMILIGSDILKKEIKLELLYEQLRKTQVDEKRMVITSTTEEKLERVISFLKENYVSDISREGLAGAMGMSSDHMSRMFKAYTGKKINEYINELRIEDAARRIVETEDKIIDIAFSVGFESLATFNRAFLKVMGLTPSDYKKKRMEETAGGGGGS